MARDRLHAARRTLTTTHTIQHLRRHYHSTKPRNSTHSQHALNPLATPHAPRTHSARNPLPSVPRSVAFMMTHDQLLIVFGDESFKFVSGSRFSDVSELTPRSPCDFKSWCEWCVITGINQRTCPTMVETGAHVTLEECEDALHQHFTPKC